jgi:hypothetical protein
MREDLVYHFAYFYSWRNKNLTEFDVFMKIHTNIHILELLMEFPDVD